MELTPPAGFLDNRHRLGGNPRHHAEPTWCTQRRNHHPSHSANTHHEVGETNRAPVQPTGRRYRFVSGAARVVSAVVQFHDNYLS